MGLANKDLWHRTPALGAFNHLGAPASVTHDVDLSKLNPLAGEQVLRRVAVGAEWRRVNLDGRHFFLRTHWSALLHYMVLRCGWTTLAKTSASTWAAPARSKIREQTSRVAPDVSTSSTSTRCLPRGS